MIDPYNDSNFHDRIKDPATYPQNLVLMFDDAYLSANDGDIEESGVEFDEYFCTAEDLSYGECPSSTMRATLINEDQMLRSIGWGECTAFIGYYWRRTENPAIMIPSSYHAWYNTTGFTFFGRDSFDLQVRGSSTVTIDDSGDCYCFIVFPIQSTLYAFGDGYTYKVVYDSDNLTYTATLIQPCLYMTQKMKNKEGAYVWKDDGVIDNVFRFEHWIPGNNKMLYDHWVYIPMGTFHIEKPSNLTGDVVTIDEAQDYMFRFNEDATDFLEKMAKKYPSGATLQEWVDEISAYVGVGSLINNVYHLTHDLRSFKYNPTSSVTIRQVLAFLADACKSNFRLSREGYLKAYRDSSSEVEEVGVDRIESETLVVSEYATRPTTKIINKNLNGKTYTSGTGDNVYYILGNPFIPDNKYVSVADFTFYAYPPMSLTVLEADPAVEVGDKVGIWLSEDEYRLFIDNYNRVFTDENGNMFGEEITAVDIPLMHRVLTWNGVCTAVYECTGNPTRLVPSEAEQTTFNSAVAFPVSYTTDSFTETIPSATNTDYEISSGVYLVTLSNNSSATNKDGVWLLYNGSSTHIVAIVTPSDSSSISCADDVLSVTTATSNMHLCVVKIGD